MNPPWAYLACDVITKLKATVYLVHSNSYNNVYSIL